MSTILDHQEALRKRGYVEAVRYMRNAEAALEKSAIDGNHYADSQYVSSV